MTEQRNVYETRTVFDPQTFGTREHLVETGEVVFVEDDTPKAVKKTTNVDPVEPKAKPKPKTKAKTKLRQSKKKSE